MMNEHGKSDRPVVPAKPPNNAGANRRAEGVEGRGLAKGNPPEQNTLRTQSRDGVHQCAGAGTSGSKKGQEAAVHRAPAPRLQPRHAAGGVLRPQAGRRTGRGRARRGSTTGEDLEANLQDLSGTAEARSVPGQAGSQGVHPQGRRAAAAARRDRAGRQDRPAGHGRGAERHLRDGLPRLLVRVPAGAQPAQCAGRALRSGLLTKKVNWVLDADIRGFFDAIDHGWLVKFVEHRIADRRVVRLIQKWLNAGVLEDGERTCSEAGTVAGRQHQPAAGQHLPALRVRPVGPAVEADAGARRRDRRALRRRLRRGIPASSRRPSGSWPSCASGSRKFGLELHPDKTRLIEFGRFAAENRRRRGRGQAGDVQLPRLHAHLREEAEQRDGSRCCGRRCASGCRRS